MEETMASPETEKSKRPEDFQEVVDRYTKHIT